MTETALAIVWLAGFLLIWLMFLSRKEWIWHLIGGGLVFMNGMLGWYVYNNEITFFILLMTILFMFYNVVTFLLNSMSSGGV